MTRCASLRLVVCCVVGMLLVGTADHVSPVRGSPSAEEWVTIGVQWDGEPNHQALQSFLSSHHGYQVAYIPQVHISILSVQGHYEEVAAEALALDGVTAVARDSVASVVSDTNDPQYGSMGYLADVGVPTAWDTTQGEGVTIAIVDSGIDFSHPDLDDNIVPGYDFVDGDAYPQDPGCGHGTRVAGIAAAEGNNGIGVVGVAYRALIMPVRVMNANCFGTLSAIAQGIIYAVDHGADIINVSINGADPLFVPSAIEYAAAHDVLVVAAAGNAGTYYDDNVNMPPASEEALVVGGVSNLNTLYGNSNFGPHMVVAPAQELRTTYPNGLYGNFSQTSAASPIVAGIAALVKAAHPSYSRAQLCWAIKLSATDLGPTGQDVTFGWGKVNAASAIAYSLPDILPAACGVNFEPATYGWSHVINTPGSGSMSARSIHSLAGLTAVTGNFTGVADFDPSAQRLLVTSDGNGSQMSTFLTVLSNGGRHLFTRMPIGSNADSGVAVAIAPSGKIVLLSSFTQSVDFAGDQGDDVRTALEQGMAISLWNADGTYDHTFVLDSANSDQPYDLAIDDDGNIYVVGLFRNTIDFDPSTSSFQLSARDAGGDAFLASYDPSGAFRFALNIGSALPDSATGVAVDDAQVYVIGRHGDTIDFDPGPGSDVRVGSGGFLSVYSRAGSYLWARDFAGSAFPSDATAKAGRVYVAGRFQGIVDMDDTEATAEIVSAGSGDAFVAAFETDSDYVWSRTLGSTGEDVANAVSTNLDGDVLLAGMFTGSVDFDPGTTEDLRTSVGQGDAFIVTLDAAGTYLGAWTPGSRDTDHVAAVHVDEHDSLHYAGSLGGPVNLATMGPADFAKRGAVYGQVFTELSLPSVTVTTQSVPRGSTGNQIEGQAFDGDSTIAFVDYSLDPGAEAWQACAISEGEEPGTTHFVCQVDIDPECPAAFVYIRAEDLTGNRTARSGYGRVPIVTAPTATPTATVSATTPPTEMPTGTATETDTSTPAPPTPSWTPTAPDTPPAPPTPTVQPSATATPTDWVPPVVQLVPLGPAPLATAAPILRGTAVDDLGTIAMVECQVDTSAGSWAACLAADGTFDSSVENFLCQPVGLADGVHTVYVRAIDGAGNISVVVGDTFLTDVAGAEPAYAGGTAECPGTITIVADRDTHIFGRPADEGDNSGGSAKLLAQSKAGAAIHILLHFALDALPVGAVIDRAQLLLTVESGPNANRTISVRQLTSGPWSEGTGAENGTTCANAGSGASWRAPNCTDTGTGWNGSGGSFATAAPYGLPLGTIAPATDEATYALDITAAARGWHESPMSNHGLALLAVGSDTGTVKFHSRTGTVGKQPRLVVDYRLAVAGGCTGTFTFPAIADTDVDEAKPTTWRGAEAKIRTQPSPVGQRRFGLIRFELANLPQAAEVTAATLSLNVTDNRVNHLDRIHALTTDWCEGTSNANGAVWADPDGLAAGADWTSGGGVVGPSDYDPTVAGVIDPSTKGVKTVDLTSLVAAWHANRFANRGIILVATGSDTGEVGYSSRADAAKGPRITGSWRIRPPHPERVTRLVVDRLLAEAGEVVIVTMALENRTESSVSAVRPTGFAVSGTGGAGAACSGPAPAYEDVPAKGAVYFTWQCVLTAGAGAEGAVTFSGAARDISGATGWAVATSYPVKLTWQTP